MLNQACYEMRIRCITDMAVQGEGICAKVEFGPGCIFYLNFQVDTFSILGFPGVEPDLLTFSTAAPFFQFSCEFDTLRHRSCDWFPKSRLLASPFCR